MIINVMGCPGIGKTLLTESILNHLKKKFKSIPTLVPEKFKNRYWKNLYKGEKVFPFQIAMMTQYLKTMSKIHRSEFPSSIIILDQCFYVLPFLMYQRGIGLIDEDDYQEYMLR